MDVFYDCSEKKQIVFILISFLFVHVYIERFINNVDVHIIMAYTEIKERNGRKYYYRVISVRKGDKVMKKRKYLGVNLMPKKLSNKEKVANKEFSINKKMREIEKLKPMIIRILKKYNIRKAGIFGSYARGEQKKNSDVDILVKIPRNMGLINFVHVKNELEDKLGKKIDLVSYDGIHPLLKNEILHNEVKII